MAQSARALDSCRATPRPSGSHPEAFRPESVAPSLIMAPSRTCFTSNVDEIAVSSLRKHNNGGVSADYQKLIRIGGPVSSGGHPSPIRLWNSAIHIALRRLPESTSIARIEAGCRKTGRTWNLRKSELGYSLLKTFKSASCLLPDVCAPSRSNACAPSERQLIGRTVSTVPFVFPSRQVAPADGDI